MIPFLLWLALPAGADHPIVDLGEGDRYGLVAVSAGGNATCNHFYSCVAVSIGGNSEDHTAGCFVCGGVALSVGGNATGYHAISSSGNASGTAGGGSAIAPFGNATGHSHGGAYSVFGHAAGGTAVSAFGNATASNSAVSIAGDASGCPERQVEVSLLNCVVIAPLGNASSGEGHTVSIYGDVEGQEAVTVFGKSSGERGLSVTGNATSTCAGKACLAASVTGHASGGTAVSACDTLAAQGSDQACIDPV